jgi:hypothetical protein
MPAVPASLALRPDTAPVVEPTPASPAGSYYLHPDLKAARDFVRNARRTRETIRDAILGPIRYDPDEVARTLARCILDVADLFPQRLCVVAVAAELAAFGPYVQNGHVIAPSAHAADWGYTRLAGQLVWYRRDGSPRSHWPITEAELERDLRPQLPDIFCRASYDAPVWPERDLSILVEVEASKAAHFRRLAGLAAPQICAAGERLRFDDASQTVTLDGRSSVSEAISYGGWRVELGQASLDGVSFPVSDINRELLALLVERQCRPLSLDAVNKRLRYGWDENAFRTHISQLRKVIRKGLALARNVDPIRRVDRSTYRLDPSMRAIPRI